MQVALNGSMFDVSGTLSITKTDSDSNSTGILNVRDYGAKGDGEADDTKAIQDALDDVETYGIVYAPPGVYRVQGLLLNKSRTQFICQGMLKGFGANTTILTAGDSEMLRFCNVFVFEAECGGKPHGQSFLHFNNVAGCVFSFMNAVQMDCGVRVEPKEGGIAGENIVRYQHMEHMTTAIRYGNSGRWAEGNQFEGGAIFSCDQGLFIPLGANAGGIYLTGVIDNFATDNSTDYINNMDEGKLGNFIASKFMRPQDQFVKYGPRDVIVTPAQGQFYAKSIYQGGTPVATI